MSEDSQHWLSKSGGGNGFAGGNWMWILREPETMDVWPDTVDSKVSPTVLSSRILLALTRTVQGGAVQYPYKGISPIC